MKKVTQFFMFGILSLCLSACTDNPNHFAQRGASNTTAATAKNNDAFAELARKFLAGAQNGDRIFMLEATNLTGELVNDCREKLIHPVKYNLTEVQRKACETVLRTSGEIDYFNGTLRKLFPKSAIIRVIRTDALGMADGSRRYDHSVSITYNSRAEALSDKSGKAVKEMVVHLFQATNTINGRVIQSFSFDSKGFDRFADKDFEVVAYY